MSAPSLFLRISIPMLSLLFVCADSDIVIKQSQKARKEKLDYLSTNGSLYRYVYYNFQICQIFPNGYIYCPTGYCNIDHSGCCPYPSSRNGCGPYCVSPGYKCCEDESGTCREDYPNCCNHYCCKKGYKCCGDECCSKANVCCSNAKKEQFCIETKPLGTAVSEDSPENCITDDCLENDKDDGQELLENENIGYFKKLCDNFAKGTRDKTRSVQFAVLTLNKLGSNDFKPSPLIFKLSEQTGNYLSATPRKIGNLVNHAEERILEYLPSAIDSYQNTKNTTSYPDIFLFTFLSPCDSCAKIITQSFQNITGTKYIAWHTSYGKIKLQTFLNVIQELMEQKIKLVFSVNGTCTQKKEMPAFVQPTLFSDLFTEYKEKVVANCLTNKALRKSLIQLINLLMWKCKDKLDEEANILISCFDKVLDEMEPKINPCMDLPAAIAKSIKKLKYESKFLLTPALNPESNNISISNNLDDLRGYYNDPFCFQVKATKTKESVLSFSGGSFMVHSPCSHYYPTFLIVMAAFFHLNI